MQLQCMLVLTTESEMILRQSHITGIAKDEGHHLTGVALRKMRNFICRDVEQRRAIPYVASTSAASPAVASALLFSYTQSLNQSAVANQYGTNLVNPTSRNHPDLYEFDK